MSDFQLSNTVDKEKIFLINLSEIEGRLDPHPYHIERKEILAKLEGVNCKPLRNVVISNKAITQDINEDDIYIGLENIVSNTGEYIKTNDKLSISSAAIFKKGQILFPKLRPYLNKVHFASFDGLCSTEFHIFDTVGLIPKYLFIYLQSNLIVSQTKHLMTGNTLPRLQTDDIYKLPVPILLKETQQKIINKYETAFNLKQQKEAEAKELLASIDDYLLKELGITLPEKDNSLKNRIFTTSIKDVSGGRFDPDYYKKYFDELNKSIISSYYSIVQIKDVITFIESGSRPKGGVGNITSGVFSIGGEHVNDKCEVGNGKAKYIPIEFHKKYLLTETKLNDIILVKDGATTGKIGIIENIAFQNQNINEHVFLIRPEIEKISALYLMYYLHTAVGQDLLKREITGATVTGLTKHSVKSVPIPLPNTDKQTEIANHISAIRSKAKQLENEAKHILVKAKQEVEQIILGAE